MLNWLIPIAYAATNNQDPSIDYATLFSKIIIAAFVISVSLVIGTFLRRWIRQKIESKYGTQKQSAVILYGRITFTIFLILGVLIGLIVVGAPLEWFSGGVGLGVALALQSIVGNFFAGIILLTQDRFNIGDFVKLNEDVMGTITDIQGRTTTLRSLDGSEVTIPNSRMLSENVRCFTKNPVRMIRVPIGVGYGSDLKKVSDIILNVIKKSPFTEPVPEPKVLISEIAASSVNFEARIWIDSKSKFWEMVSHYTKAIFEALMVAGIDIPYPVSTLRVDSASSDLLATNSHLIEKLQKIEGTKINAQVFQPVPEEVMA